MVAWQKVIPKENYFCFPCQQWDEKGAGGPDKEMWWGMMVKLRRSHLTILLLGVDQYGFMMRRQWLQEINTEHHPKVSQKIWTYHRTAIIAPWCYGPCPQSGNTRNMKLTAICLYFYGSLFQFCWLGGAREDTDWLTDQAVSQASIRLCHHLLASLSFKTILQISAQSWFNGQAVSKNTNQSRWRLKSESLAVRFLNINYLEIWPGLRWKPANPTGIECLVWVKWILPELLLSQ